MSMQNLRDYGETRKRFLTRLCQYPASNHSSEKIGTRTSLATQKPVFQIPFFSLLTASLSRDLISPFPANYFFQLSFSLLPGALPNKKNFFTFFSLLFLRILPSVLCSLLLLREPALLA